MVFGAGTHYKQDLLQLIVEIAAEVVADESIEILSIAVNGFEIVSFVIVLLIVDS